jgi:ATP-dependent Clp protease adaptor protein ClpS
MATGLSFLTGAFTSEKRAAKQAEKKKLKPPDDYNVILLNDNYTTMEFVVDILMLVFHKEEAEATRIMLDVHRKNKGLVGRYSYDIAATKVEQVKQLADKYGYPLQCVIERA